MSCFFGLEYLLLFFPLLYLLYFCCLYCTERTQTHTHTKKAAACLLDCIVQIGIQFIYLYFFFHEHPLPHHRVTVGGDIFASCSPCTFFPLPLKSRSRRLLRPRTRGPTPNINCGHSSSFLWVVWVVWVVWDVWVVLWVVLLCEALANRRLCTQLLNFSAG
ncbi:hypothetical protein FN846DRAFT_940049 [Sphaerosporella brunnea]|uniref:Uncharacterized protein n=1 Tax=Sphaerosporella brunnea TaxID=1250544 RepID=A0A5J5F2H4_9PEZI|nr:hypothetical protein FN846DRAFT_940049 [Sphaerosporella brunnea]